MKVALVLASLAVLFARPAHADQCEWLEEASIARRAARELTSHPEYLQYCEPCGDQAPGTPRRASKIRIHAFQGTHELLVDDVAIDLAYVYVRTTPHLYRNLALLAGCPTTGVATTLHVRPETPTGVVILADAAPPQPSPAARRPVQPEPRPEAAPRPGLHVEEPSDPRGWLTVVALLASLGALVARRLARRRLAHVPRAASLRPRD